MKNKPVTYALIIAVVGIWAWIIYSVFGYMDGGSETGPLMTARKTKAVTADSLEQPEYILALDYKDPFLKKEYYAFKMQGSGAGTQQTERSNISSKTKPSKTKEKVVLPPVQYLGRIGNSKSKPVAILLINNNEYMLQETQSAEGVTLAKINPDSVKVQYSNTSFYVRKNK